MMEKFFSFMSFYEQHQQAAPAQSNNSNNNNGVTPMRKGVSSDSIENSSRDNNSSNNIGSNRDGSRRSNIGKSRSNNNSTNTNRQLLISTNSHHRYHTDSRSTRRSQKCQHYRKFLLQLRSVQTFTWTSRQRIIVASKVRTS
ncbi:unnamed protein product [Closterium sp. NIES-54]